MNKLLLTFISGIVLFATATILSCSNESEQGGPVKNTPSQTITWKVGSTHPANSSVYMALEESSKTFSVLRKQHSAVEANINQLEHNGVNKCPDKGIYGFRRYVALGVIAYNLHHLGKLILKHEKS